ncbi:MAG TPA: hypothetical protein VLQ45_34885, partial [Thermoanaerobaculia bacterium]|nr:hypothetical protein [Thermoanaerobaculia bacterium]
ASMATVTHTGAGPRLEMRPPELLDVPPREFTLRSEHSGTIFLLPYSGEIKDVLSVHMPIRTVNRHHTLARIVLDARWLEEKTTLQDFADKIIWRLSNPEPFSHTAFQYQQKRIGHLYRNLDWESIDREIHPPYRIYTGEGHMIEVTSAMLDEWADVEVNLGF